MRSQNRVFIIQPIQGFSLVELIVVVAIVGILASIAIPSYNNYTLRSRRTEGKMTLLKAQAVFEQFYTQNNTYVGAPPTVSLPSTTYYSYATSNVSANGYTITATATGTQANDTSCTSFSIDNLGNQKSTPNSGSAIPTAADIAAATACWSK